VYLCDPVLEGRALGFIFDLPMPHSAFKSDELPLLKTLGELREIPPGIDAMPLGAGFVVAFVVLQLSWVAILRTTYSRLF
jgi:hypothetical protein